MVKKYLEEKRKRARREENLKTAKNVAVGTAIGTFIGAITGILFAPKSGKETREDIANKTKEVAGNIKEAVYEQMEVAKKIQGKVKDEIKQVYTDIKEKKKVLPEDLEDSEDVVIVEENEETEESVDITLEEGS
ncbi:MAG: YtxH domain-containing protein [Tissierellia bacterium]|nr:YtxH domain-containing protein [Tissierellia bacterium]